MREEEDPEILRGLAMAVGEGLDEALPAASQPAEPAATTPGERGGHAREESDPTSDPAESRHRV